MGGGGGDEVSYGDSNMGGWSQSFFGMPADILLGVQIFYHACGYFTVPAGKLLRLRMLYRGS